MSTTCPSAARRFSMDDQRLFATISGDFNPMHVDPVAARRTPAGGCVVHGVHSMLWALESLTPYVALEQVRALDADFSQFLYVGEEISSHLVRQTEHDAKVELRVVESLVAQCVLKFGPRVGGLSSNGDASAGGIEFDAVTEVPLPLTWEQVARAKGRIDYFSSEEAVGRTYPKLSAAIGMHRVRALLSLTRLVGMVCPGLHSTFHRISVQLVEDSSPIECLHFMASASDPRFDLVTMAVRASGISGSVRASRRQAPTAQDSAATLRARIGGDQFRGSHALVVGGSRGLGELTAKLLAMGGAEVTITFAQGSEDAEAVAADIRAAGGRATTMRLDVLQKPLRQQLEGLPGVPLSMYYFATPRISRRPAAVFSPALFQYFVDIYVEAFDSLCRLLGEGRKEPIQVFYPSTVFVEEPTRNMSEYAMAKAAGEVLAANITRFFQGVEVEALRLPRLPTDQTASMIEQAVASPVETMLPILQRLEQRVTAAQSRSGS